MAETLVPFASSNGNTQCSINFSTQTRFAVPSIFLRPKVRFLRCGSLMGAWYSRGTSQAIVRKSVLPVRRYARSCTLGTCGIAHIAMGEHCVGANARKRRGECAQRRDPSAMLMLQR
jgi:hypothetical protein